MHGRTREDTAERRFWSKVDKSGDCWLWTASIGSDGAGQIWIGTRNRRAYQVAYQWLVGPVPVGMELDHLCRDRRCVNPDHLEPVTHGENIRRGLSGQLRTVCKRGHELVPPNLYVSPGGKRTCRTCRDANVRAFTAKIAATPCRLPGCGRGVKALGLCAAHWYANHRYGDPLVRQRRAST